MAMTTLTAVIAGDDEVKLRSVCDSCTTAKVKCNGKVPCERCLKRGIECQYLPFKSRSGGGAKKASSNGHRAVSSQTAPSGSQRHPTADLSDCMLDENEKKIWSVFFTLYRSFAKGCSQLWFKQQLFKMLRFLEKRALVDAAAANALGTLRSWMGALGIDVQNPPIINAGATIPDLKYSNLRTPFLQTTLDNLKGDVERRNLPMLSLSRSGKIEVNEAFAATFAPSVVDLQSALEDSAGGFLPWGGDVLARIFCKESDLILYIQGVANNLDAIGRPPSLPYVQSVPSMNIVHVNRKKASGALQEVLCVVRAVQVLYVDANVFEVASTITFEIPEESEAGRVPEKARRHEEMDAADTDPELDVNSPMDDATSAASSTPSAASMTPSAKMIKGTEEDEEQILPLLPDPILDEDEAWLDNLLSWAAADAQLQGTDISHALPVADDMFNLHVGGGKE